jgi:hypothetical protein
MDIFHIAVKFLAFPNDKINNLFYVFSGSSEIHYAAFQLRLYHMPPKIYGCAAH